VRHVTPPRRRGPRGKTIDKRIIGPYLRRRRRSLGLTQEEVADAAGIDRSLYNAYENERRGPEITKASALAKALRVPEEEILVLAEERGVVAELAAQMGELRHRVTLLEQALPPAGQAAL